MTEDFGRMPRPQDCDADFSDGRNANWTVDSMGSLGVSCSGSENKGQRQGSGSELVVRRYTFKLYPNRTQLAALVRQASLLASLWNAALEQRELQWAHECQRKAKGERKGLSKYDQGRDLKLIRANDPEYATMSADTMNLCLIALDNAFKAFFRRAKGGAGKSSGYPRYKSPYAIEHKGADCTIWHRDHRKGWRLDRAGRNFKVYAKGIPGMIRARGKFPVDVDDLTLRDMRLIRVGGVWQLSVVVRMAARREKIATAPTATVKFDLIDEFASVEIGADGECLPGWAAEFCPANERISPENEEVSQQAADDSLENGVDDRSWARGQRADDGLVDEAQSECDTRFKKFSCRWRKEKRRIAKMKAKEARRRKEALHRWTTQLIAGVSELTVVCPPIKESTHTARGDEKCPGAAVKTIAILNRHVLAQAPATALAMLEYKAAEAGIPFARITPDEHALAVGRDLPAATKAARKASRALKRIAA